MNRVLQSIHDNLPQWMADWFDVLVPATEVVLIFLLALAIMRVARGVMARIARTYGLPATAVMLTQRVLGFFIYGGAMLWALERMGVSGAVLWSAFTGFAAVGAVAFFAVWSVLSNLFCAILIFTTSPFRVGDLIEVLEGGDKPGVKGRVLDINLVYTTLLEEGQGQEAKTILQLPNSMFFQRIVRRWSDEGGWNFGEPCRATSKDDAPARCPRASACLRVFTETAGCCAGWSPWNRWMHSDCRWRS
jgi:small-conductance mechanosensitive channel